MKTLNQKLQEFNQLMKPLLEWKSKRDLNQGQTYILSLLKTLADELPEEERALVNEIAKDFDTLYREHL